MEAVMSSFYMTLLQLKYPEITKASPEDLHSKIFTGQNRIALLAWLLSTKSTVLAATLEKLEGRALEDELAKYYSEIGVCNNKNILLGKCKVEEDVSVLSLLHEFVNNIFKPAPDTSIDTEESITDIVKTYITNGSSSSFSLCNITSKLSYSDAVKYIESIQKTVCDMEHAKNEYMSSSSSGDSSNEARKEIGSNADQEEAFVAEKENFIKAFTFVSSWQIPKEVAENDSTCMDGDIKDISSKFSFLRQTLQVKDEISKMVIPDGLPKTDTPLNSMIEDVVIRLEELRSTDENDYVI